MLNSPRYLFDSDVLIAAKNVHYQPAFCAPFWDWIADGHTAGTFYSIDKVKGELLNGKKDVLYSWCQEPALSGFFLDTKPCVGKWSDLSKWAMDPKQQYVQAAKAKFLAADSADAWLIAYAAHAGGFSIITNETSAPVKKANVKLPDAASAMGVVTVRLHDVLTKHAAGVFKFKQ